MENHGVTHMRRDTSFSKSLKNVYAGKIRGSFHCLITMSWDIKKRYIVYIISVLLGTVLI